MKKLVLAALAASLVATPTLAAAPQHGDRNHGRAEQHRTVVVHKQAPNNRKWQRGQRFDARYARNYRQVDYRQFHGRLKPPPRGYRYVRSGSDVVLVSIAGGIIGAVFANMIR